MKKHSLFLSILLVLFWSLTTYAVIDVSCFHDFYTRGKGKPVAVSKFFTSAHQGAGKITIINGDLNDPNVKRVTSARIWLNGVLICVPSDWNSNVTLLVKPVTLQEGENKLEVLLYGPQRGKISLEVTHEVDAEAGAYVSSEGTSFSVENPISPFHGVELVVPAGAVTEPTLITIKEPSDIPPIPDSYEAEFMFELQPEGTNFKKPIELRIPSWSTTDKLFYVWNDEYNEWSYVVTIFDDVANTYNLKLDHMSIFGTFDSDNDVFKPCSIIKYYIKNPYVDWTEDIYKTPVDRAIDTWEDELENIVKFVWVKNENDANLIFEWNAGMPCNCTLQSDDCVTCESVILGRASRLKPKMIRFNASTCFNQFFNWSPKEDSMLEKWEISIEEIALHEIGHALGLDEASEINKHTYCNCLGECDAGAYHRGINDNPVMCENTRILRSKYPVIDLYPYDRTKIHNLYSVVGGCTDSDHDGIPDFLDQPPIVEAFSVNLNLDKHATATYTVSDTVGLERVELWRTTNIKVNNNDYPDDNNWQPVTSKDEQGLKVFGTIIDSPPAGVWWYGIHVVDTHGTCTTEENKDCTSGTSNGGLDLGPVKVIVKPKFSVMTQNYYDQDYFLAVGIESPGFHHAWVVDGPNIINRWENHAYLSQRPNIGDEYTIWLCYDAECNNYEVVTYAVTAINDNFATIISPADGSMVDTDNFPITWQAAPGTVTGYSILVYDQSDNFIWGSGFDQNTTATTYNFDGTATEALQAGKTYNIWLHASDENGNQATTVSTFYPFSPPGPATHWEDFEDGDLDSPWGFGGNGEITTVPGGSLGLNMTEGIDLGGGTISAEVGNFFDEYVRHFEADIYVPSTHGLILGLVLSWNDLSDPAIGYRTDLKFNQIAQDIGVGISKDGTDIGSEILLEPANFDQWYKLSITYHDNYIRAGIDGNEKNFFCGLYQKPDSPVQSYCSVHGHDPDIQDPVLGINYYVDNIKAQTAQLPLPVVPTPTGLAADYVEANNWNWITWNNVPEADSYNLYWGTESGVTQCSEFAGNTPNTEFSHTGVVPGSTYYYKVTAVDENGIESALSNEDSASVTGGLNAGLVAYYPFDGNADDDSGNAYHGTVYGPTPAMDRDGNPNSAYYFNYRDYIEVHTGGSLFNNSFTISVWVNFDHFNNDYPKIIHAEKGNVAFGGTGPIYQTDNIPTNLISFNQREGSGAMSGMLSDIQLNTGEWYLVTIVRNNLNYKMYINTSISDETTSAAAIPMTGTYFTIGSRSRDIAGEPWGGFQNYTINGYLDEIRIYNRALSAAEIQALYNLGN